MRESSNSLVTGIRSPATRKSTGDPATMCTSAAFFVRASARMLAMSAMT